MVLIGQRRRLCEALVKGPLTSAELVGKTRTDKRYVRKCLGAQAGENNRRQAVSTAGFNRFRRAAQTPVNIVYEARP